MVQEDVLEQIDSRDLAAYAVWEPILKTDDERSSRKASTLLPGDRVKHYWVDSREVGKLFQPALNLTTEPAWDVYLVYEPGILWSDATPPSPTLFMHQLGERLSKEQRLEGPRLHEAIKKILGE